MQTLIEKNKNDTCAIQTHVDLKTIKWVITDRGIAVGLLQAGVSKQEVGLHFSSFLENGSPELIDFYTLPV